MIRFFHSLWELFNKNNYLQTYFNVFSENVILTRIRSVMKNWKSNCWVFGVFCLGLMASADINEARSAEIYTVKSGDTLYAISRRFSVGVNKLAKANGLSNQTRVKIGQKLKVPSSKKKKMATLSPVTNTPSSTATHSKKTHTVKKGETLYSLARTYGLKPMQIARHNGLSDEALLKIGQKLTLPLKNGSKAVKVQQAKSTLGSDLSNSTKLVTARNYADTTTIQSGTWLRVPLPQPKPGDQPVQLASLGTKAIATMPNVKKPEVKRKPLTPSALLKKTPQKYERKPTGTGTTERIMLPDPVKRAGDKFQWPLRGRLISNFGAKEGGLHNDGINIQAKPGTKVQAADNGVVVYVGNELRGFGNLVLLKHSDNWVTAYAHNERALVKRGQKVKRGQAIAQAGATGGVTRPQLHFEVRKKGKAVDPLKYLSR